MRAGELTERIEILEPVTAMSASGSRSTTWESRGTWFSQVKSSRGYRTVEGGELFPDHTATFLVRGSVPTGENWRLRHNGILYSITSVETSRRLGMKTLTAERVNL